MALAMSKWQLCRVSSPGSTTFLSNTFQEVQSRWILSTIRHHKLEGLVCAHQLESAFAGGTVSLHLDSSDRSLRCNARSQFLSQGPRCDSLSCEALRGKNGSGDQKQQQVAASLSKSSLKGSGARSKTNLKRRSGSGKVAQTANEYFKVCVNMECRRTLL
jgi:hypothetical protein